MKRHEAMSVGDIIDRAIAQTGNQDEYNRQQACYLWQEVVGPALNRYTVRRWIEGRTMHVVISSASLKNDLMFRKGALAAEINRLLGNQIIDEIVIH